MDSSDLKISVQSLAPNAAQVEVLAFNTPAQAAKYPPGSKHRGCALIACDGVAAAASLATELHRFEFEGSHPLIASPATKIPRHWADELHVPKEVLQEKQRKEQHKLAQAPHYRRRRKRKGQEHRDGVAAALTQLPLPGGAAALHCYQPLNCAQGPQQELLENWVAGIRVRATQQACAPSMTLEATQSAKQHQRVERKIAQIESYAMALAQILHIRGISLPPSTEPPSTPPASAAMSGPQQESCCPCLHFEMSPDGKVVHATSGRPEIGVEESERATGSRTQEAADACGSSGGDHRRSFRSCGGTGDDHQAGAGTLDFNEPSSTAKRDTDRVASTRLRIVDFGSGSGNLILPLALMFPACDFVAVDMKAEAITLLRTRAAAARLSNITAEVGRIESYREEFDVCLALHACGHATDAAMLQAQRSRAAMLVSPCCVGKLLLSPALAAARTQPLPEPQQQRGAVDQQRSSPRTSSATAAPGWPPEGGAAAGGCQSSLLEQLEHPRSKWMRAALTLRTQFEALAKAADYSHVDMHSYPEDARAAKANIELDRAMAAAEAGFRVQLIKLRRPELTTKSDLIVGVPEELCGKTFRWPWQGL